jgi:hypothetical protein
MVRAASPARGCLCRGYTGVAVNQYSLNRRGHITETPDLFEFKLEL